MNYSYEQTASFKREFKRLNKKHKSLKFDLETLKNEIENNPDLGVELGNGFRKLRLKITSKNKGKSGGARVITSNVILNIDHTKITFVYIWDKSETDNISDNFLSEIAKDETSDQ